ncbi:MAG: hypothetical protein IPK95_01325 [Cellvibrionales bacterium]|nr:hypothetical protein [Cellvibrionales bacterium]
MEKSQELNRALFKGKIIGLTGSAGKTTTKEMISAILSQHHCPLVTVGNLNNHIGVPLSLLGLSPGKRYGCYRDGRKCPG